MGDCTSRPENPVAQSAVTLYDVDVLTVHSFVSDARNWMHHLAAGTGGKVSNHECLLEGSEESAGAAGSSYSFSYYLRVVETREGEQPRAHTAYQEGVMVLDDTELNEHGGKAQFGTAPKPGRGRDIFTFKVKEVSDDAVQLLFGMESTFGPSVSNCAANAVAGKHTNVLHRCCRSVLNGVKSKIDSQALSGAAIPIMAEVVPTPRNTSCRAPSCPPSCAAPTPRKSPRLEL